MPASRTFKSQLPPVDSNPTLRRFGSVMRGAFLSRALFNEPSSYGNGFSHVTVAKLQSKFTYFIVQYTI
jgi:hypothetical protein